MATYNGERFIADQIDSLLRQTETQWHLTIRDDRSTDRTHAIALEYARRHPERITVQQRETNSGSAKQNFLEMLGATRARHVMFCDHDDVWAEDKVAVTLTEMRAMEDRFGSDLPMLVHTDLTVTDSDLRVLEPSMMRAQQLDGTETRLPRLVAQNVVTGCTVMVNRALADLVRPPFDAIVMHDWWLAMIAAAVGRIAFLDAPTVLYRQHGANVVGARQSRTMSYKLARMRDPGVAVALRDSVAQAAAFLDHFEERLSPEPVGMLRAYAALPRLGKLRRIGVLRRYGFWKNTLIRRLGQLLYV
jgi:glycosyltransferase involved in cell wall biosynthesis